MSLEMYQEQIIERYRNPVNIGTVENPDATAKDYNPSCGDDVEIQIKFDNDVIRDIKFQGHGCAISQSSTDLLMDLVKKKNVKETQNITKEMFLEKVGIPFSPLRLKCALLGFKVFKLALYSYLGK
ncbi:MAG: iron-sulfur cluster assembly scaffold protein [Candidatus Aenigmarchaeota archaeon]|nr:iron-sulfur cluster assembly scaffold protein [Candidatus Aenigmarchaeota archaeon]